jgi:glycosyltransferase involved in cell wall biosynthesis
MTDSSQPLVTIGIPTYNRAASYLPEALESALAQTYPNFEIVVSDNASPDNTETLVRGYADPRIRYFRQSHGLIPNDNFNFCLQQARGTYFLMLHDDDLIDRDFVEVCMQAARGQTHYGIIRTATRIINANGVVLEQGSNPTARRSFAEFFLDWFAGKTSIYVCATLFNTAALRQIGGFRSRHNLFQDVTAVARIIGKSERLDVDAVKASARWHGAKFTHAARVRQWCEDSLDLLELLCELAPEHASALRERGLRFFANVNYKRASDIRAPLARFGAYAFVYRNFGKRFLPPPRMVLASTILYRVLRNAKRRLLGMPAWVD